VIFCVLALTLAQCSKDTDCKGDRVCENGKCVGTVSSDTPASNLPPLVADLAATGGVQLAISGGGNSALGALGLHGSVGGRLTDMLALALAFDANLGFFPLPYVGVNQLYSIDAAARVGISSHLTAGLGVTVLNVNGIAATALMNFLVRGVLVIVDGFGVHAHFQASFNGLGALFSLGAGVGWSFF
jgi:hypothetical protein